MSPDASDAPLSGRSLGAYRVMKLIGAGGMGQVYLAQHELLGHQAAVKVLLPSLKGHELALERFFREARLMAQLKHPGLVEVFDYGTAPDGTSYLVMELLDGETLSARLKRENRLTPEQTALWGSQIAGVLDETHRQGIIHRDLKPSNIFIVSDADVEGGERTKLLDFGIAKLLERPVDDQLTASGMVVGTPVFMSPEQCRSQKDITGTSDVYSLGCLLYTMLATRPPFVCSGFGSYIIAHCTADVPPLPSTAHASEELRALVDRMLSKEPSERPSAAEVRTALEDMNPRGTAKSSPSPPGLDGPTQIDAHTAGVTAQTVVTPSSQPMNEVPDAARFVATEAAVTPYSMSAQTTPHSRPGPVAEVPHTISGVSAYAQPPNKQPPMPTISQRRRHLPLVAGACIGTLALVGIVFVAQSGGESNTATAANDAGSSKEVTTQSGSQVRDRDEAQHSNVGVADGAEARTGIDARVIDAGATPNVANADAAPPLLIRAVIRSKPNGAMVRRSARGKPIGTTPLVLERAAIDFPITLWLTKSRYVSRKIVVSKDTDGMFTLRRRQKAKEEDPLGRR